MSEGARSILCLALLAVGTCYAVVTHGGDGPLHSSVTLLLLGFAGIVGAVNLFGSSRAAFRERLFDVPALLFPVYVAFQLVPLPLPILRIVSPTRAEVADALRGVMSAPAFAPLSIAPPTTWVYLLRTAAYAVVFLMVRQIARQHPNNPWRAAVPLLLIGALETVWALMQVAGADQVSGSYYNRNHLAGLLEMLLPFAAMYGIAVLRRRRGEGLLDWSDAVKGCTLLLLAVAMFVAVGFSLSRMGFVSTLIALLAMGVVGLGRSRPAWGKSLLVGCIMCGLVATLLLLSPPQLVERFGEAVAEPSQEGRTAIWKDTGNLIRSYPLFGVGLGSFFPGILRYQTSGLNRAWTATHNDYLQLLSELGFVGWLLPAALMCAAFTRAVFNARSGRTLDARLFGLACTGSIAAILSHSMADFNTYVLANALVLSWVAGLAAALLQAPQAVQPQQRRIRRWTLISGSILAFGSFLVIYNVGWLVFLKSFRSNPVAEQWFCRFGICDTSGAVASFGPRSDAGTPAAPPERLREYLRRDPAGAYQWEDLGRALLHAGRTEEARYSFSRALALAPASPPTLLGAADFHLSLGETARALTLLSTATRSGAEFDEPVFIALESSTLPVEDVLRYVDPDRRFSQSYLRRLLASHDIPGAETVWHWMVARGYADDKVVNEYVEFLLRNNRAEAAAQSWAIYAAGRNEGYPESNRVFNGDFESDPTGSRLDWTITPTPGVAIDFDREVRYSGGRALRIGFDGTSNPGDIGVAQAVFLPPGTYRFRAYMRTEEVSTDQGVAVRVMDGESPAQVDVTTAAFRGSNNWTLVEAAFDAPPSGGLVRVLVVRKPSLRFDNLIRGIVWIDAASITPVDSRETSRGSG